MAPTTEARTWDSPRERPTYQVEAEEQKTDMATRNCEETFGAWAQSLGKSERTRCDNAIAIVKNAIEGRGPAVHCGSRRLRSCGATSGRETSVCRTSSPGLLYGPPEDTAYAGASPGMISGHPINPVSEPAPSLTSTLRLPTLAAFLA